MFKLTKIAACLAVSLAGGPFTSTTFASTTNATFMVTVRVNNVDSCRIAATRLVSGNSAGVTAGMRDAVATITSSCTPGAAYTVALDAGSGGTASLTSRKLGTTGGATPAPGNSAESTRVTGWGQASNESHTESGPGIGMTQSAKMYVRVPTERAVSVGLSSETVTVTLTY